MGGRGRPVGRGPFAGDLHGFDCATSPRPRIANRQPLGQETERKRGDLVCVTQARSAPFVADKLARQHVCV